MIAQNDFLVVCVATLVALATFTGVESSDPELTTDFFVPDCMNISDIDGNYFTFSGFRGISGPAEGKNFSITKATSIKFPALTGLGVSYALLNYLPGGINNLHTHPRGTELLYVITGTLEVGLVDSTNKLYTQTLVAGDLFVFPKGLVHYQYNLDAVNRASALSAFSSSNSGLISLPINLFGTAIDEAVLTKAFNVNGTVMEILEASNSPKK